MVIWLFILKIAAIVVQVRGQPQGFLSIDCGIASTSSYVDEVTNITYVSDDQYVSTGSIHDIDANYNTLLLPSQVLINLRSFPDVDKNCYTLPVVEDQRYLVRAWFMYGNYDGKNSATMATPLQFDLHLGSNLWKKMNITDASVFYIEEALTLTITTSLSICLINTGNGDPFISALELRPLKNTMYNLSQSDLALFARVNIGPLALTDKFLRYPTDPYDRIWRPYSQDSWVTISTELNVDSQDGSFEAPSAVLQTASTPAQGTTLTFEFNPESEVEQFYTVLYFTEVQVLAGDSVRKFDIYRNDQLRFANFTPPYLSSGCLYSTAPFNGSTSYIYSINATDDSTLPPLINALEIYSVMPAVGAEA